MITCSILSCWQLINGEGVAVWVSDMPASRLLVGKSGQVAESAPAEQVHHRRHRKIEEL